MHSFRETFNLSYDVGNKSQCSEDVQESTVLVRMCLCVCVCVEGGGGGGGGGRNSHFPQGTCTFILASSPDLTKSWEKSGEKATFISCLTDQQMCSM